MIVTDVRDRGKLTRMRTYKQNMVEYWDRKSSMQLQFWDQLFFFPLDCFTIHLQLVVTSRKFVGIGCITTIPALYIHYILE